MADQSVIPYSTQTVTLRDVSAVVKVLCSPFLTTGPRVPIFEETLAELVGAKHGVAMNSATSALHAACAALRVAEGSLVWTSPISFVASANCALYCGADVDFVDIDPKTLNMCPKALEAKLSASERRPDVIIPIHMSGFPADMKAISSIAKKHGIAVIEDASHALGARIDGDLVGNCKYSDITVFSFHPVKIITTGEGGMATTNSVELAEYMRAFRSHGIVKHSGWQPGYYEQVMLGMNYRMTDIAAALGTSQLSNLDDFCGKRYDLSMRYCMNFEGILERQHRLPNAQPSHHLHVVRVPKVIRNRLHTHLHENKILVQRHYIPIYWQPYYHTLGFREGLCPNAEDYYQEAISLPIYPDLSYADQNRVIETIKDFMD